MGEATGTGQLCASPIPPRASGGLPNYTAHLLSLRVWRRADGGKLGIAPREVRGE